MTNVALNQAYRAMYAQLVKWQADGADICSDWYAGFSEIARQDFDENRSLYA